MLRRWRRGVAAVVVVAASAAAGGCGFACGCGMRLLLRPRRGWLLLRRSLGAWFGSWRRRACFGLWRGLARLPLGLRTDCPRRMLRFRLGTRCALRPPPPPPACSVHAALQVAVWRHRAWALPRAWLAAAFRDGSAVRLFRVSRAAVLGRVLPRAPARTFGALACGLTSGFGGGGGRLIGRGGTLHVSAQPVAAPDACRARRALHADHSPGDHWV